ncbi:MAG: response regulator [Halobacteriota archaeon]
MAKKESVLIVEDEAIVAEDLEMVITDLGYEVVGRVASAGAAVKKALELKPDLVLMDIVLKGQGNGIDASLEIKNKLDIPIIFLTAYSDMELIDRAKSTAPYAYLVKPFQDRQLLAAIQMALYKSRMDKKLKESEVLKSTILETVPVAVIHSRERHIIFANKSVETVFGWKLEELIGKSTRILYRTEKEYAEICAHIYLALETQQTYSEEVTCRHKDGRDILCTVYASRMDGSPKNKDFVIVYLDITERKRAENALKHTARSLQEHVEQLEESKRERARAYRLREYFLKETSHRIITPVCIIGGYADLLLESGNLDEDQREKIRIIREKNEEILQLVKDSLAGRYSQEETEEKEG